MEPKSELARYAYGYSNRKPEWTFWVAPAIMVIVIVIGVTTL